MAKIMKLKDSRRIFIDTLCELAKNDDKVILIICDTGFNYIEKFQKKYPKRFFNFGVTEQSSMIIASAMALAGYKPWIYSMINFMVFRPYEMVRNAVCMHNANVKIVGVKGSEKYKFLGFSHNLISEHEDFDVLRNLPILLFNPTLGNVKKDIKKMYEIVKPCYIRL